MPENNDRPQPPITVPREALRRIDWLEIAPWIRILRAPGAVVGVPLLLGAIGTLFGGEIASPHELLDCLASLFVAGHESPVALRPESWSSVILTYFVWLVLGVGIAGTSAGKITDSETESRKGFARQWGSNLVRTLLALVLIAGIASPLALLLFGFSFVPQMLATPIGDLTALVVGLPLMVACLLMTLAVPLMIAAVVIDDADPFDAVSRTAAYTLQKPFTLGWAVLMAIAAGIASSWIIEGLIQGTTTLMQAFGSPTNALPYFAAALRGFYPAYLFVAGVAVYLVMRKAIDGQPLNEMGPPQSPDAA